MHTDEFNLDVRVVWEFLKTLPREILADMTPVQWESWDRIESELRDPRTLKELAECYGKR